MGGAPPIGVGVGRERPEFSVGGHLGLEPPAHETRAARGGKALWEALRCLASPHYVSCFLGEDRGAAASARVQGNPANYFRAPNLADVFGVSPTSLGLQDAWEKLLQKGVVGPAFVRHESPCES